MPIACSYPRCPGVAVRKGRCALHAPIRDGYSPAWRALSTAVRREVGACQDCGATTDLTVDHLLPGTLGGTDDRRNLRVRCRVCHARFGRKRTTPTGGAGWQP